MPAGFHPYTHFHFLCRQITVELLRFLAVLQSPLLQFPGFGIHKSSLLKARAVIASYNQHIGSFLPTLFRRFPPPTLTPYPRPPTSSCTPLPPTSHTPP